MRGACILFAVSVLALAGCGGGGAAVQGKVVKAGNQYALADGEGASINLTSTDGKVSCSGQVQKDGTFTVTGPGGGLVPAGKYKVGYTYYAASGAKGNPTPTTVTTADTWDVPGGPYTVDIGKK